MYECVESFFFFAFVRIVTLIGGSGGGIEALVPRLSTRLPLPSDASWYTNERGREL